MKHVGKLEVETSLWYIKRQKWNSGPDLMHYYEYGSKAPLYTCLNFCTAILNDTSIAFLGGEIQYLIQNKAFVFDFSNNKWTNLADLPYENLITSFHKCSASVQFNKHGSR